MSAEAVETLDGVQSVDGGTGEIHRPQVLMTEDEARTITAEIKAWAGTLWLKLKQAHDGQAWRAMGYSSWRDYIDTEFDMGKSQAYRLLTHANAVYEIAEAAGVEPAELSPAGDTLTERATRELDIDAVIEAVQAAMLGIEPGAKATRVEITERIIKELRAQAKAEDAADKIPTPGPEVPAPPAPVSDPPSDAGGPPAASDGEGQDPAPGLPQPPGEAGAPESRTAAPGDAEGSGTNVAQTGSQEDDGGQAGTPPAPPVVTPELAAAAERAAVSAEMVAARPLLNRDPADVVALMAPEDAEVWIAHKEDMAEWFHGFDAAMTDRNQLRSV